MNYELRNYQIEAIDAIKQMNKGENGIISLPMGSGKTIIMAKVASEIEGRVLISVPSVELMSQTIEKLKAICSDDVTIGCVQGKLDQVDAKICVCTRQSLTHKKSTRMQRMQQYGQFEIIFFDECHQAPLQLEKIVKELSNDNCKVIGMSATPFNVEMRRVFDKIIFERDILWMIDNNYLVEPKSFTVDTKTNLNNVHVVAGEFNQCELEKTVNTQERNNLIVESYKKYVYGECKHTICFCSGIDHCKDLTDTFIDAGIKCGYVDSTLSKEDRESVIDQFKNGDIEVICNVGVLTTGFDHPPTDCILVARPMKSKILFLQSIGRGLRLSEDKNNCLILDFKDILHKHSLVNLSSIFDVDFKPGETLKEAKKRKKKDEEDMIKAADEERIRQEEIVAKEIQLLNSNIGEVFENSYYDWFQINYNCYALSQECDLHYAIAKFDEDEFIAYEISTEKGNQYANELDNFTCITDAIKYIEEIKLCNGNGGYPYRNVRWKFEPATENQLKYIKYNRDSINTKWQVHKYFKIWLIEKLIKKSINNLEECINA